MINNDKFRNSTAAIIFLLFAPQFAQASGFGCMLKPIKTVDIRSPVVGRLSSVQVERGNYVKKGQVLARLDNSVEQASTNSAKYRSQTQAQIIAAQNRVNAARQKMERMKILSDAKFMSTQALDDANNELKVAESELDASIESQTLAKYEYKTSLSELNRRTINSPLSGVVTARYLDAGSIVSPTDGEHPILTLAQTDRLKVQIIAPVKYFNRFKKGGLITISPEAPFNRQIKAKIAVKDSAVDAASGTFSIISYINNPGNKIPSGILCSVKY
ncbi:efflux RND transporter periplasmic adaptor subunit [Psychrobacter sp. NPDC077938]|uniref:efflux RND transporter periplasmic adaptor subunit n=1 Tax=Psychrobacter sp. NPDC077938 TaxID=3364494 RepID=UPI0037C5E65D